MFAAVSMATVGARHSDVPHELAVTAAVRRAIGKGVGDSVTIALRERIGRP